MQRWLTDRHQRRQGKKEAGAAATGWCWKWRNISGAEWNDGKGDEEGTSCGGKEAENGNDKRRCQRWQVAMNGCGCRARRCQRRQAKVHGCGWRDVPIIASGNGRLRERRWWRCQIRQEVEAARAAATALPNVASAGSGVSGCDGGVR